MVFFTFFLCPLLIIYLFNSGWWMIFCEILYYAELLLYLFCSIGCMEYANKHSIKSLALISSLAGTLIFPLCLYAPLPLWMVNDDFLKHVNFTFGTSFDTTYEYGIVVTWVMVGFGFVLFGFITGYFSNISRFIKNKTLKKHTLIGIGCAFCLCLSAYLGYQIKNQKYAPSLFPSSYATQMQKEENEIDQQLESDKQRLIQKAANDYRRQWE